MIRDNHINAGSSGDCGGNRGSAVGGVTNVGTGDSQVRVQTDVFVGVIQIELW